MSNGEDPNRADEELLPPAAPELDERAAAAETIGLIAGNGRFPLIFSREARARGYRIVAVAHRGETDDDRDDEGDPPQSPTV